VWVPSERRGGIGENESADLGMEAAAKSGERGKNSGGGSHKNARGSEGRRLARADGRASGPLSPLLGPTNSLRGLRARLTCLAIVCLRICQARA